jgi:hypothetical protein
VAIDTGMTPVASFCVLELTSHPQYVCVFNSRTTSYNNNNNNNKNHNLLGWLVVVGWRRGRVIVAYAPRPLLLVFSRARYASSSVIAMLQLANILNTSSKILLLVVLLLLYY